MSKSFCFTINNWTEDDVTILKGLESTYLIYGEEKGKEGTPHLQGYITFKKTYRLKGLKELHAKAHWEVAKTREAAIEYCKKEGKYSESGKSIEIKSNKQGKRTDLEVAVDTVKLKGLKAMIEEHPKTYVRFHSGFEKLAARQAKPRDPKNPPIVTWLWGPSGTGKTRQVVEKEPDLWMSGKNLKWWEGYENQEAILIDDFRGDFCTFHELLRIIDRYPYKVEVKGGSRELNSKRIYITSCHKPELVYDKCDEEITQLLRRITLVTHVGHTKKVIKPAIKKNVTEVAGNTKQPPSIDEKILPGNWFENSDSDSDDE